MMKALKIVGALACFTGVGLAFGADGGLQAVGIGAGLAGFVMFVVGRLGDG